MLEYLPWSKAVLEESLEEYRKGRFSVLDIELGGACNFSCIYCDSPDRQRECSVSVETIERFLESRQFKWIHICGIGEPTVGRNYELLIDILGLCEKYGVKCNMFSNIINLTSALVEYVKKEILYILFKIDTLSNTHAANLYGINTELAQKQIENIKKLVHLVQVRDNCTNLAASIVPTNINWSDDILGLVKSMFEGGIFPMIGDLENSGRGREYFEVLHVNTQKLNRLKKDISDVVGADYAVPQCPAVISAIHISADNEIIVDEFTGLSCNWFWLEEPKLKTLVTLDKETTLEEVTSKLMDYRKSRLQAVQCWLSQHSDKNTVFGGCGGDIFSLLNAYLTVQEGA